MTRPGDDLPRIDVMHNVPDGYAAIRGSLPPEEAFVAQSFLSSNDIPAALVSSARDWTPYTRQVPQSLSLCVPEDRVEEAEALLASAAES